MASRCDRATRKMKAWTELARAIRTPGAAILWPSDAGQSDSPPTNHPSTTRGDSLDKAGPKVQESFAQKRVWTGDPVAGRGRIRWTRGGRSKSTRKERSVHAVAAANASGMVARERMARSISRVHSVEAAIGYRVTSQRNFSGQSDSISLVSAPYLDRSMRPVALG
jgi:hypothetical protein